MVRLKSQIYFTTGGLPPISSSWQQSPWDSRPVILFSNWILALIVLMKYILFNERMSLSFTVAGGPRQRSHSQVRVPRDSWPYFTVSDLRFPSLEDQVPLFISPRNRNRNRNPRHWVPFSSPPTTLRVTVEVFDPASTRDDELQYLESTYLYQIWMWYWSNRKSDCQAPS
jgi:hypothetical protein